MIIKTIRATIMEMASSEILSHIPANIYEEIKTKDPHPEFRAYVVGHEGISEGKVVGQGDVVKRWFASAIEKIVEKLQYGTKIFHRHAKTNVHSGRGVIGRIVGKAKQIIDDNLSAIAIAYIEPDYRDLKLDVASIEADVILSDDQDRGIYDANVENITGIALGNSSSERPGFPGATLVSQIQAFAQSQQYNKGGRDMSTISEVRDFIKSENVKPSDLFGLDDLIKDLSVERHFREDKANEYEARKRVEQERIDERKRTEEEKEKEKKEREKTDKVKDDLILKLKTENIQSKTTEWLETQKEKRELDEEQMKYIGRNLSKFTPEDPEKAEDEFNKFLDDQVDELSGIKTDVFDQEPEPKDKKKIPGGEPKGGKKEGNEVIEDMSLED
ncbi:MAG: hypothetical protein KAV87_55955 [Desulfobacteraceae bacterium]|nr:hypothetical protein [Desulfobacteraceae bacterium]